MAGASGRFFRVASVTLARVGNPVKYNRGLRVLTVTRMKEAGVAMNVGNHIDGRVLGYDESVYQFSVGSVPVSFSDVRTYDQASQIVWLTSELRAWFYSIDENMFEAAQKQAQSQYRSSSVGNTVDPQPCSKQFGVLQPAKRSADKAVVTAVVVAVALVAICICVTIFFTTKMISTIEEDSNYGTLLTEDEYGYGYDYGYDDEYSYDYGYPYGYDGDGTSDVSDDGMFYLTSGYSTRIY